MICSQHAVEFEQRVAYLCSSSEPELLADIAAVRPWFAPEPAVAAAGASTAVLVPVAVQLGDGSVHAINCSLSLTVRDLKHRLGVCERRVRVLLTSSCRDVCAVAVAGKALGRGW